MSVLIVGSIALDTVKTPAEERADLLGGSASYAAVAASFFSPVRLVGIVGRDFPAEHVELLRGRGIDLAGLEIAEGSTFRWSGEYHDDLNTRSTRSVELNVFESFSPSLPGSYADTPFVLLANIAPSLQLQVLDQMASPRFVVADTMDLWIQTAREDLLRLLGRVDLLIINDGEARQLTGEQNLIRAGRAIQALGPRYVALKKGEHGCLLFGPEAFFTCGAFPLERVADPTGAGDTFAGGLVGYLAGEAGGGGAPDFEALRRAVACGSVLASFNVESFSMDRLKALTREELDERLRRFHAMSRFELF